MVRAAEWALSPLMLSTVVMRPLDELERTLMEKSR
jgi:hypothetical protein